jgi:hypothetical protein
MNRSSFAAFFTLILTCAFSANAMKRQQPDISGQSQSIQIACSSEQTQSLLLRLPEEVLKIIFFYVAGPYFTQDDWMEKRGGISPEKLVFTLKSKLTTAQSNVIHILASCASVCKKLNIVNHALAHDQLPSLVAHYHIVPLALALRHALTTYKLSLSSITDICKCTALHAAICHPEVNDIVQILLLASAHNAPKLLLTASEPFMYAPLHLAALFGKTEIAQMILQAGKDQTKKILMLKDSCGKTARMLAQENNNLLTAAFLQNAEETLK